MKRNALIVMAAILALLLTACGSAGIRTVGAMHLPEATDPKTAPVLPKAADPAPTPSLPETTAVPLPVETSRNYLSLEEAKALVFTSLGITEADTRDRDYDLEHGRYELDFKAGKMEYEFHVDAITGQILRAHQEPDDDLPFPTEPAPPLPTEPAPLTLAEAKALVFATLGITEADTHDRDYELEDGVYELEFQMGNIEYEFLVDAATGTILKMDQDIDD